MAISDDPLVRQLRDDAIRHDEWATKKYWLHLFQRHIFPEHNFVVATEQPPLAMGTQRKVDITVENFEERILFLQLIVEAKKGRAAPRDIVEVETQLYSACYEHYTGNRTRRRIWAMSVTGPCVRIWAFDAESGFLTPALPVDNDHGEKASYIDFKTSERKLMDYFAFIKQNPVPPDSIFDESDISMSDTEILDEGSVVLAKAIRIRSQGLEIELIDGGRLRTVKERWEVARCTVEGQVVNGHKYVGTNSGHVYFAMNVAEYL
jgi:hypothetical protein